MASPPSVVADAGEKHWVWCRRVGSVLAAGALLVLVAGRTVAPTRNGMLLTTSDGAVTAAAVTVATGLGQPPGTGAPRKPPLPPPPPTPAPAVFRQGNDMSKPTPEKQTSYDAHAELRKGCVWSPALPAHQLLPPGDVEARSPSIGSHCPADQAARNFFFCTRPNAVHDSMCPGGPAAEFESERVTASKCVAEGVTAGGTPTTTVFYRLGPVDLAVNTSALFAMIDPFGGHMAPTIPPAPPAPARAAGDSGPGGEAGELLWWIAAMASATDSDGEPYGLPPVHVHHSTRWHLTRSGARMPYAGWEAWSAGVTLFPGGAGDKQCLGQDGGVGCLHMSFPRGYAQPPLVGNVSNRQDEDGDVIEGWFENLGTVDLTGIYFEYAMTGRRQAESQAGPGTGSPSTVTARPHHGLGTVTAQAGPGPDSRGIDATTDGRDAADAARLKAALQFTFIINGKNDFIERYAVVANAPPKLQYRSFTMAGPGSVVSSDLHAHAHGLLQAWLMMGRPTDIGLPHTPDMPDMPYGQSIPASALAEDGQVATAMEVVAAAAAVARVPLLCNWTASTELVDGRAWDRAALRDGARSSRWVQPERCTGFRFAAGTVVTLVAFHHLDTTLPGYGGIGDLMTHTVWQPMIHLDGLEAYDESEGWGWGFRGFTR